MNATRICSLNTCDRRHFARGYCKRHYNNVLRTGDPNATRSLVRGSAQDRIAAYTYRDGSCLRWTGYKRPDGYGLASLDGRMQGAHRVSYIAFVGPIPDGMEVDHTCYVRDCVEPSHLRLVTRKENNDSRSGRQVTNTTGVVGVHPRRNGMFQALIRKDNKRYHVGTFASVAEAHKALDAERARLGLKPAHVYATPPARSHAFEVQE